MNHTRLIQRLNRCGAIDTPTLASQWLRDRVDTSTRRALMDKLFPKLRVCAIADEKPFCRVKPRVVHHEQPHRQFAPA